jgi:hypothetical protein
MRLCAHECTILSAASKPGISSDLEVKAPTATELVTGSNWRTARHASTLVEGLHVRPSRAHPHKATSCKPTLGGVRQVKLAPSPGGVTRRAYEFGTLRERTGPGFGA